MPLSPISGAVPATNPSFGFGFSPATVKSDRDPKREYTDGIRADVRALPMSVRDYVLKSPRGVRQECAEKSSSGRFAF